MLGDNAAVKKNEMLIIGENIYCLVNYSYKSVCIFFGT